MKKYLVLAMAIAALAACAAIRNPAPVAIYDFGLQPLPALLSADDTEGSKQLRTSLLVAETIAPAWLDSTSIHYRLAYDDPTRFFAYRSSRWASTPAKLLTQRVRTRIAAINERGVMNPGEGTRADYILRLDLEEFAQVFDTPSRSSAIVQLRASLVDRVARYAVSQRSFRVELPAPTANATGAVKALAEASDQLIESLIGWLEQELRDKGKESFSEG
ncbi:MAG: membrane integrity-associated transporter subunit PqiC [Nitrosospira multiformis]|nr:membrane integrity-associated transporter subunit PqiC [Nitrosospira multiformis]